jgi:hypothetical protein
MKEDLAARPVIGIGQRAGLVLDDTDLFIGAEARIPIFRIHPKLRLDVRPTFDFDFVEGDLTAWDLSGDVLRAMTSATPRSSPTGSPGSPSSAAAARTWSRSRRRREAHGRVLFTFQALSHFRDPASHVRHPPAT